MDASADKQKDQENVAPVPEAPKIYTLEGKSGRNLINFITQKN
jgi:hypothetical protein